MEHTNLYAAGNFSAYDLKMNHAGHISIPQQKDLKQKILMLRLSAGIWGISLVTAIVLCIALGSQMLLLTMLVSVFCAGIGGFEFLKSRRIAADLAEGKISALTKPIMLYVRFPKGAGREYRLIIGPEMLVIQRELFEMLKDGEFYTVYFTPRSKILLAIEPAE